MFLVATFADLPTISKSNLRAIVFGIVLDPVLDLPKLYPEVRLHRLHRALATRSVLPGHAQRHHPGRRGRLGRHARGRDRVFARRGMGFYASSLSGDDVQVVEDFELPPDCAVQACGSIEGTVTDSVSGDPIAGVTVAIAGQNVAGGLSDVTDASGEYSIEDVPFHVYPALVFDGAGYEPSLARNVQVVGAEVRNRLLTRDWASLEGGAELVSYTPPDYAPFCGTNANGAFDLSLGAGWPSDAVGNGSSGVSGPRRAVVKLPVKIDVSSFAVASGGTCGDSAQAGVKAFTIQTRRNADAPWRDAVSGIADNDGELHAFPPDAASSGVRFVRFVMRSNHGDVNYMDVLEVSVRGTP